MAKKDTKKSTRSLISPDQEPRTPLIRSDAFSLDPKIKYSIIAIVLLVLALIIILGAFGSAGVAGNFLFHTVFENLFGFGVIIVPVMIIVYAIHLIRGHANPWTILEYISATLLGISTRFLIQ
jgi:hypothetical protein